MATQDDVRRIALALPGVAEDPARFAFSVDDKGKPKGLAWVWLERTHPKKARVPNPAVLAVRVRNLAEKELILSAEPAKYFTEPHYNGYPAVLVRLEAVTAEELRPLLEEAWRCSAPRAVAKARDAAPAKKASAKKAAAKKSPTRKRAR